jgi:hypothetical protein
VLRIDCGVLAEELAPRFIMEASSRPRAVEGHVTNGVRSSARRRFEWCDTRALCRALGRLSSLASAHAAQLFVCAQAALERR